MSAAHRWQRKACSALGTQRRQQSVATVLKLTSSMSRDTEPRPLSAQRNAGANAAFWQRVVSTGMVVSDLSNLLRSRDTDYRGHAAIAAVAVIIGVLSSSRDSGLDGRPAPCNRRLRRCRGSRLSRQYAGGKRNSPTRSSRGHDVELLRVRLLRQCTTRHWHWRGLDTDEFAYRDVGFRRNRQLIRACRVTARALIAGANFGR